MMIVLVKVWLNIRAGDAVNMMHVSGHCHSLLLKVGVRFLVDHEHRYLLRVTLDPLHDLLVGLGGNIDAVHLHYPVVLLQSSQIRWGVLIDLTDVLDVLALLCMQVESIASKFWPGFQEAKPCPVLRV